MEHPERLQDDLMFHERRLCGLFNNRLGEEMEIRLEEKLQDRTNCDLECSEALRHFEQGAQLPPQHTWDTLRVPSYLRLELEPRFLVGSIHYELPEKADRDAMIKLLGKIKALMEAVPSAQLQGGVDAAQVFEEIEGVEWSKSDVARLTDVLSKKFYLLQTMDALHKDLQAMEWGLSRLQLKKEELGRQFEKAAEDGDLQVSNEVLYDRLTVHEDLLKFCNEKVLRLEEGLYRCLEDRQHRLGEWKKGAAALEVLKDSKVEKQSQCQSDLSKLQSGMEYAAQQAMEAHHQYQKELLRNDMVLDGLRKESAEGGERMQQLIQQFMKEEAHLRDVAAQRQQAIQQRISIINKEAQRVADFEEFLTICKQHEACLKETLTLCKSAVEALNTIQLYCAGSNSFLEHDFSKTRRMLTESATNGYRHMRQLHVDMYRDGGVLQRRLEHRVVGLNDEFVRQQLMAEECRETFNPTAKKHVMEAQRLSKQKEETQRELDDLLRRMNYMDETYFVKVQTKFGTMDIQVEHPRDMTDLVNLNATERLLDHRDTMLESGSDMVLEERENLTQFSLHMEEQKAIRQAMRRSWSFAVASEPSSTLLQLSSPHSYAPLSITNSGFPTSTATSTKQPVRVEVRKVAAYTAVRAPVTTQVMPSMSTKSSSMSDISIKHQNGGSLFSVAAGRASPLEIARTRRLEPRMISDLSMPSK